MSGSSDAVRAAAKVFVHNQRRQGKTEFSLSVKEVKAALEKQGFPPNNTPQVCSAMRSRRFLESEGLELVGADGPPSLQSTTVVFHYRCKFKPETADCTAAGEELDPRKRAFREAAGSLRDVFAEFGGGEKFLAWVRQGWDRES